MGVLTSQRFSQPMNSSGFSRYLLHYDRLFNPAHKFENTSKTVFGNLDHLSKTRARNLISRRNSNNHALSAGNERNVGEHCSIRIERNSAKKWSLIWQVIIFSAS